MQNSLESFLESADGAGQILAHARLLTKLARIYQNIALGHLGQASRLANFKSGIVVIHADNGAVAAKLRQLAPTLADAFSKKGIECNDVQIKVQAAEKGKQSKTSTQKPLSSRASHELEILRDALPDSPLRSALETLLERTPRQE